MSPSSRPFAARPVAVDRQDCTWHVPQFCEENVHRLARVFQELAPETPFEVVFVSNSQKKVPFWFQRSATSDAPVIWDYHVLLLQQTKAPGKAPVSYVYDMDSKLPFPTVFAEFAEKALRSSHMVRDLTSTYQRLFRVVDGALFLRHFASDRSHMMNDDGSWIAEPPTGTCIETPESKMNLLEYIDMTSNLVHPVYGTVLNETEFTARYSSPSPPPHS
ncbi:WDYHV motif containing 1-like protein [Entophlyctis helioformis]|nr:WDYHV motif containing 1-like protein [Entophlyctis helioformis]